MSFQNPFLQMMWGPALAASKRTGLDPRLIVAQAALESNWGKSAPGNNYFGIKGQGNILPTTEVVNGQPTKVSASFRKYQSPSDSVNGYADFVTSNPRYKPMLAAQGLDAQINALGKSGYATDPNYADKVRRIASSIPMTAPVTPVLNQAQQDFVNNNPQPGGYGPGLGDPNQPTDSTAVASVPGSMVPDNSIPSYVADYATEDPNKPNFLQKLGKALEGMKGPRPPYLPPHPLGAGPGNQLLQYLNSPTYADLFMKKRMGG